MRFMFGIILIIWAFAFAKLESEYFGGNWFPESVEELVCDLTALVLVVAGNILLWNKRDFKQ